MDQRTAWIEQAIRMNALYVLIINSDFIEHKFPVWILEESQLDPMRAQYENSSFETIEETIDISKEKEKKNSP